MPGQDWSYERVFMMTFNALKVQRPQESNRRCGQVSIFSIRLSSCNYWCDQVYEASFNGVMKLATNLHTFLLTLGVISAPMNGFLHHSGKGQNIHLSLLLVGECRHIYIPIPKL